MNRHIGTRFEGHIAEKHLRDLTGESFFGSFTWEDGRIRDPGDYVGKHRSDVHTLRHGLVFWSNLFMRFRRVTSSNLYCDVLCDDNL